MAKRKAISTRTRFEIFKRDGFRCAYCGATPLQSPLHVDHVKPVADGGSNDPANLITACGECNGGKSAVPLEQRKFKVGDEEQAQEHLEQIRAYLEVHSAITSAKQAAVDEVNAYWEARIGPLSSDMAGRMRLIVSKWPLERLLEAIDITANNVGTPGAEYDYREATQQAKYFHGVLRRWREENTPPPPETPTPAPKPTSIHVQRVLRHFDAAIVGVKESTDKYPTRDDQLIEMYRVFVRAAWGSQEDHDWAPDAATEYRDHPFAVRGLVVKAENTDEGRVRLRVAEKPDFNPYQQAYEELRQAIMLATAPGADGHPDPAALRALDELDGELYYWLELWHGTEGVKDFLRKDRAERAFFKRWELD